MSNFYFVYFLRIYMLYIGYNYISAGKIPCFQHCKYNRWNNRPQYIINRHQIGIIEQVYSLNNYNNIEIIQWNNKQFSIKSYFKTSIKCLCVKHNI
jgi:hypothetical protein